MEPGTSSTKSIRLAKAAADRLASQLGVRMDWRADRTGAGRGIRIQGGRRPRGPEGDLMPACS
jgi:hypothetical protein